MNDEGYSNIYDTIHKGRGDESPDQLGENPGPLYDEVHEDLGPENDLYATRLESHEYDSLSVYALRNEETNTAFSESESGDYLLPDDVFSEAQNPQPTDLQPTEYHEVRGIFMEEPSSAIQDAEPLPEEPQQNGRMLKMESPLISSFTIQHSKGFSISQDSTCYSIGLEENKATSLSPEIFLFVKVRTPSGRHTCKR